MRYSFICILSNSTYNPLAFTLQIVSIRVMYKQSNELLYVRIYCYLKFSTHSPYEELNVHDKVTPLIRHSSLSLWTKFVFKTLSTVVESS